VENAISIPVAEMSRPKRRIQEWLQQKRQKTIHNPIGPPVQRVRELAKATNWFQPIFWTIITEVAEDIGWQMSPTEIVRGCQTRSIRLFRSLHADVIGKWINRTGSRPCWSAETLAKVAKENCPGGNITRKGILVSCELLVELSELI
jgi:hypothetical protein